MSSRFQLIGLMLIAPSPTTALCTFFVSETFDVPRYDDAYVVSAFGKFQVRIEREVVLGDGVTQHIDRYHILIILRMRLHIIAQHDLDHRRPLGVTGKDIRSALVVMRKVVVERGVNICALLPELKRFKFFVAQTGKRHQVALPIVRRKYVGAVGESSLVQRKVALCACPQDLVLDRHDGRSVGIGAGVCRRVEVDRVDFVGDLRDVQPVVPVGVVGRRSDQLGHLVGGCLCALNLCRYCLGFAVSVVPACGKHQDN